MKMYNRTCINDIVCMFICCKKEKKKKIKPSLHWDQMKKINEECTKISVEVLDMIIQFAKF